VAVCGASAATAAAAAVAAPKSELTLAISLISVCSIFWLLLQPYLAQAAGFPDNVAGAWLGGSVDLTGAVVAAAGVVSPQAEATATIVKLTQNSFLGVYTLGIAAAWMRCGPQESGGGGGTGKTSNVAYQLWQRFPKFVLGYLFVSLIMSTAVAPEIRAGAIALARGGARFFFAMGFVGIGFSTSLEMLVQQARQPAVLYTYLVLQVFDIALTLAAAFLAFGLG
ncbi:hypothetical protein T484DRAFT_1803356, partial [Baffinella frigidus]